MNDADRQFELTRLPTQIPGLDEVLNGGLFVGGTYLLTGPSGVGKTVLATQISFALASEQEDVLFVTLLTESHARMLGYMQGFEFFDPAVVGTRLYYVSGYEALQEEGLDGLVAFLFRLLRERRPRLFVLDGLMNVSALAPSVGHFRRFIHDLAALVESTNATALLIDHRDKDHDHSQFAMVDGVIELLNSEVGQRANRELLLRKLRGSGFLAGRHVFEISLGGIRVHPRAELLPTSPLADPVGRAEQQRTGIEQLDVMLGGGLTARSVTLLLGPSGSGKTTAGLRFLQAGAEQGQRSLMFGFYEQPPYLLRKAAAVGLDIASAIDEGSIVLHWSPPLELLLDAIVRHMVDEVDRTGARRLFLDGLNALEQGALYPARLPQVFSALAYAMRSRGVSMLVSAEIRELLGLPEAVPLPGLSPSVDNLIVLRHEEVEERRVRLVSVVKTREHESASEMREYTIGSGGLQVAASSDSAREALRAPRTSGRR